LGVGIGRVVSDKMSGGTPSPPACLEEESWPLSSPFDFFSIPNTPPHILKIPLELLTMIMHHLDLEDLAALFSASWKLRIITMTFIHQKLASDADMPALQWAVTHRKHRLLEVLSGLPGYSIDERDAIHSTPLKCAVACKDPEMVSHVLSLGADVHLNSWSHGSLLHLAASRDDLEVTELLLNAGMDPNIRDPDGETPLDWVVERASWPVAQLLIRSGATINHQNSETGMTPLHRAVIDINSGNGWDMIKGLLNEGASPNILNHAWLTPLGIARRMQSYDLVDLLFYYGADQGAKDLFGYGQIEGYFREIEEDRVRSNFY